MKNRLLAMFLAAAALVGSPARASGEDLYADETPAARDARMAWWREAKFGMFIHWGVYAVPAGIYENKEIPNIGEWIMRNAQIPVATYRNYANSFNPVKYDPAAWAELAREAGMRYVVITAKHHDGFALFPSEATQWDVADATPWKKDLIAPLAEATRQRGLHFGLYYSQAQDWTHPGGAKAGLDEGGGWDDAHKGSFDSYIDQIAVPQVREILTRYQPDVLWWDTPIWMNEARAKKLINLLPLRPGIIHNNRLGGPFKGDTETPEQHIPTTGFPGRDWETCMTLNDTWGFKKSDQNWKPLSTLITNLVDIASKGGNYLLNIGPDAEGQIPSESIDRLRQVGAWMKTNGESIYGTQASPFRRLPWGRCTRKIEGENTVLYLHVLNWPQDGNILVPGLQAEVVSCALLANQTAVPTAPAEGGLVLSPPGAAPDPICSTIKLVVRGTPKIDDSLRRPDPDGVIRLLPNDAVLQGKTLRTMDHGGISTVCFWINAKDGVSWNFRPSHDGRYMVRIEAATPHAGAVLMVQGIGKLAYAIPQTGAYDRYQTTDVGEVTLTKNQAANLTLLPVPDGWQPANISKVELIPQP